MDAQKFGAFIAQCRKEKGMTQSDLAAKIMVTDKAVSRSSSYAPTCGQSVPKLWPHSRKSSRTAGNRQD